MSLTNIRLNRELLELQNNISDDITAEPVNNNIRQWIATIKGPSNTPYKDGTFKLQLDFDDTYPMKPPSVKFLTLIYHPNVYRDGKICLDILQSNWSPVLQITTILISIQSLLMDPNIKSPANRDAAVTYSKNRKEFNTKVTEYINKYCDEY